jgi:hypothetical protein
MSNESPDRQRLRQDLQELALQAKATPASLVATADSSGFVDLSAFSATDASWVDRELARTAARPPPASSGTSNAIDSLSPQSTAPVARSAPRRHPADLAPSPRRRVAWVVAGLASVAGVGALAVIVARSAPSPTTPVAATDTGPAATAAPSAAVESRPDTTAAAPAAITQPTTTLTAQGTGKRPHSGPSHAVALAAVVAQPSARPATVPQSTSPSSGDSLMDMMRASVKAK